MKGSELTEDQTGWWALHQLDPDLAAADRIVRGVDVEGAGAQRVRQATLRALTQTPALCLRLIQVEGAPRIEVIDDPSELVTLVEPAQAAGAADQLEEPSDDISKEAAWRLLLEPDEPLARFSVVARSQDSASLLICAHRMIADPFVVSAFIERLCTALGVECDGPTALMRSPSEPDGSAPSDTRDFWRDYLANDIRPAYVREGAHRISGIGGDSELGVTDMGSVSRTLGSDLGEHLEATARSSNVSVSTLLALAVGEVLAAWVGADRFVVPVELVGAKGGYLFLKFEMDVGATFIDSARQLDRDLVATCRHAEIPFRSLVEHLGLNAREAVALPIVLRLAAPHLQLDGFSAASIVGGRAGCGQGDITITTTAGASFHRSRHDLEISLAATPKDVVVRVDHRSSAISSARAAKLMGHLAGILRHVADAAHEPLGTDSRLTPAEVQQLVIEWNDHDAPPPTAAGYRRLFDELCELRPNWVALVVDDLHLTCREINERATAIALHALDHGVGPNSLVGVVLEPNDLAVIGQLGLLKAGASVVDLTLDAKRQQAALENSDPSYLLSDQDVDVPGRPVFQIAKLLDLTADSTSRLGPVSATDGATFVSYTSGSTGNPKGVVRPLRPDLFPGWKGSLVPVGQEHAAAFLYRPQVTLARMVMGETIHLAAPDRMTPFDIITLLMNEQISIFPIPPSVAATIPAPPLPAMSLVAMGAERVPFEAVANWVAGRTVRVFYSLTEAGYSGTVIDHTNEPDSSPVSVGRSMEYTSIYLVDDESRLAPSGVPGVAAIASQRIALGYLNSAGGTAGVFHPDPFSPLPGGRLCNTGDVCVHLASGECAHLGRIDFQVQIHGHRVELGEIEAALTGHATVASTVVAAKRHPNGEDCLVAYCVPAGTSVDGATLRAYLEARLAPYMVPTAFVEIKELPVTGQYRKVDRRNLPDPDWGTTDRVAPRDTIEEELAAIWAKLLRLSGLGVHDDFFALGGDSVTVGQLSNRISETFGVEISIADIFRNYRTIAALGEAVLAEQANQLSADDFDALLDEVEDHIHGRA